MANQIQVVSRKLLFLGLSLSLSIQPCLISYADTTINSSPANTGNFTLSDHGYINVNANIIQNHADGSGGIINLTAGTIITVNNGRILDVSATAPGKNGGSITLSAPALIINGILKANGMGSGRGGLINLNGTGAASSGGNYINIGNGAVIEAKGGSSGGLGGLINIVGNGSTAITLAPGSRLETTGGYALGANEIYIQGDGTDNSGVAIVSAGELIANAPAESVSSGGLIRFSATRGGIAVEETSRVVAQGGGSVELVSDGRIRNAGTLDVSGGVNQANGGNLLISGDTVIQRGNALAEGGENGHGGNIEITSHNGTLLTNLSITSVKGAGNHSDSGNIKIWSDTDTFFKPGAVIDASGGQLSGNGGFVEVSAKNNVYFLGSAFGGSADGLSGTIFIDPTNITIANGGANTVTGGDDNGGIDEDFAEDSGASVTYNPQSAGTFNDFRNIWLQATNDITINSAFDTNTATGRNGVDLKLEANNNININSQVTTHNGVIDFIADADSNGSGNLTIASTGGVSSLGADINLQGASISVGGIVDSGNGAINITSSGDVSINGSTGGYVTSTKTTSTSVYAITLQAGSTVNLVGGANPYSGSLIATSGGISVSSPNSMINLIGGSNSDTGAINSGKAVLINTGTLTLVGGSNTNSGSIIATNDISITANGLNTITWNGPDGMLYSTAGTTNFVAADDVTSYTNFGMTFSFYGTNVSAGSVSSNGFLWMGNNATSQGFTGLPKTEMGRVFLYGTDLDPTAGGTWSYKGTGSEFIVNYNNVPWWNQPTSAFNAQLALLNAGNSLGLPTGTIVMSFGNTVAGFADPAWGANPLFSSGLNKGSGSLYETLNPLGIGGTNGVLTQAQVASLAGRAFAYIPNGTGDYIPTEIGTSGGQGGVSASGGSGTMSGAISSTSGNISIISNNTLTSGTGSGTNSGRLVASNVDLTSNTGSINVKTNATTVTASAATDVIIADSDTITISSATVGRNLTVTAGPAATAFNITLNNANVTGNTVLAAGGTITATTNNNFTGSVSAYGESGTADFATSASITDNSGDMTVARITANAGTMTAGSANGNMTVSNTDSTNGTLNFVAPKNITFSTNTINGTDTINLNSTNSGDIIISGNTLTSVTGTTAAPSGASGLRFGTATGNVTMNTNTVSGAVAIGTLASRMQGDITGTGNTFSGTTSIHTSTAKSINLTSNFVSVATNAFSGGNVTLSDPTGTLYISSVAATNLTASATQATTAGDLTILNANVTGSSTLTANDTLTANSATNVDFGTLTATAGTAGGSITIAETTPMTIGTITNASAAGATTLATTGGAISGKGTAVNDIVSAGTGTVTLTASNATSGSISLKLNTGRDVSAYASGKDGSNNSIYLYGSVGRNLVTQLNSGGGNTTGNIYLGDYNTAANTLNVVGTTSFKSASDAFGYGTFTGAVTGNGARVDWWQVGTTSLTVGSITASATASPANEFWAGYNNILNIYAPDAAIIENADTTTVDLTATNGAITLWAGDNADASSYIQMGISTTKDVYMWASGDSNGAAAGGTSINVQTGTIGGKVVAVSETWDKTTGDINVNLTSGNITTRDVGSAGNITLTATNGSVLQSNDYALARDVTVYSTGNTTIQAGDSGASDTGSYIDTGVYVMGNAVFIAAGKSGANKSVQVIGQIDGTTTVKNEVNAAVKADVYLGTTIGAPDDINDTTGVLDTYGDVNVNSLGNVYLNGGVALSGALTVTGSTVTIRQDIGRTKIASITTTKTSGTAVDIWNYTNEGVFGDLIGTDITTASLSSILIKAGNAYPSDANAYITDLSVNTGGNLTVYVAGDSNGTTAGGVSVNITGTVAGTRNAYNESGGTPTGSVTMP